ncbi:two-component system histidine kinase PnpS [Heyndrickxia coagulans]|uniref:histidine kinase n=1 Tax=Heyndrickxia coagulans DSM 1 = ATCC 7050 TaxID=1121088 RepID=A0A8B4BYC1_HEYCO|nr:ATP-binding protein [Heyndrickxia coagulans]AJH76984.1 sensory box protein [Heyndrickxia coagulans DSM 1 = ATCC 7050]MCR2847205.1 cell wall metabolism sensor histidine kinase WalK [Heyndrickxia coagulans]MDR4224799.1 cell wall metabolism sensor histidine kinase WalK [Heyndrickxia coagulans DSM 1 = ATCC 7050]MED4404370.1 ATP-binding protein [Heyndrickxia coagulans]MED4494402.1 ATP-binding protein [Heyndrickxia coagulans]
MNKLWIRIFIAFLSILAAVLLAIGFFVADMIQHTYMDMVRTQLSQDADLLMKTIRPQTLKGKPDILQKKVRHYYSNHEPRITIIDTNGKVLADSDDDPAKMENHANRPEFRQVITQHKASGESIRSSHTLGYNMMYVANPVKENGKVTAVIRTSIALDRIDAVLKGLWFSLGLAMAVAFLISGWISYVLARKFTRPIEASIEVSNRLIKKDYDSRVHINASGELRQLTKAINNLAHNLKQQMNEIDENEQQLTAVLENMDSGVMLIQTSGRIMLVNRAMEEMTGLSSGKLIGKRHIEAGKSFGLSQLIDRSLKTGERFRDEVHLYYPKERILDAHIAPYVGESGELRGVVAVLHDVTETRRLEQIRSEFVANVSHELKTPVTSVKGFAETLLDGAMYDEATLREFLKIIYDESDRLHRLISDILDLSRIEQHRIPLKMEQLNVVDVITETAQTMRKRIEKKQLELVLPQKRHVMMEADKDRLRQILLNLVTNAIAYTPDKGRIEISLIERENELDLIVSDTGIGISEKDLPRIFERFYRVDKARSRQSGGTGLGLAIVKHLVESYHGKIRVESEEGKGSTFIVTLPRTQTRPDAV